MDWRALLHNKWVWAGVGVATAAGLVVLYRRRAGGASGGGASSAGAQTSPAYSAGGVGGFDSTGTDVANWLGNYSGNLQNQLNEYQAQLTDALAALQNVPTSGTGTPSEAERHAKHLAHIAYLERLKQEGITPAEAQARHRAHLVTLATRAKNKKT